MNVYLEAYNRDLIVVENEIDRIRQTIEQQSNEIVQSIENEKKNLLIRIEDYIQALMTK